MAIKIPVFTRGKLYMALGLVAVMLVVWALNRWISSTPKESNTSAVKEFQSTQMRKLPCGRFQKQIVEVEGATGVKTVQILDRDGVTLLKEKRMPVDLDHCQSICKGLFVPELWKDCRIAV